MRIFLTGATGFLGRHLLARLDAARFPEVRCLVRDEARLPESARRPGVTIVPGDLRDATLGPALAGCDVVVHLAALTGKASARELQAVNVDGTRRLLEEALRAGVPRFLHAGTIATSYPEKRYYPYARSKEAAEALVRASGLDWLIVRPTVVLGPGSPTGRSLLALAEAPVLPLFGGGKALVHPVHVEDVVTALLAFLEPATPLGGRTVDVGGRDVLPFGDFLRQIRRASRGKDGPALPIPLRPLLPLLAALEGPFLGALPVTAGQLYAFRHDGVATAGTSAAERAGRRGVADLVAELTGVRPAAPSGPAGAAARAGEPPLHADRATLEAECDVLARHVAGLEASPAVRAKYVQAHEAGRRGPLRSPDDEDDVLVHVARGGPLRARLADAWAAVFDRGGPLRRKLVLLVAILESGPASALLDRPDPGGLSAFVRASGWRAGGFALAFLAAAVVIGPRWLLAGRGAREAEKP